MRSLAILLIGCIVFISCFSGIMGATISAEKNDCCKKMKIACRHQPQKKNDSKDCGQSGCAMMFSCTICGFLVIAPFQMPGLYTHQLEKPVAHYKFNNQAGYHPDNWKPPQFC